MPNAAGLIGVLLILAGSTIVVERREGESRRGAFLQLFREPGVQLRFAALVCSATEAVFLKRAVLDASPVLVFYMLALFQLSTLISVFLGCRYFDERSIARRLIGSIVMIAGAVMIVAVGRRG